VTLTSLNLGSNSISDAGATQLAECLRVNATLTSLILASNSIGDAGASRLEECLLVNETLMSLDLANNFAIASSRLAEQPWRRDAQQDEAEEEEDEA
jgi:hypothetical protein